MAKPNYAFEKRQRELAKKRKKEEKTGRKGPPGAPGGDVAGGAEVGGYPPLNPPAADIPKP